MASISWNFKCCLTKANAIQRGTQLPAYDSRFIHWAMAIVAAGIEWNNWEGQDSARNKETFCKYSVVGEEVEMLIWMLPLWKGGGLAAQFLACCRTHLFIRYDTLGKRIASLIRSHLSGLKRTLRANTIFVYLLTYIPSSAYRCEWRTERKEGKNQQWERPRQWQHRLAQQLPPSMGQHTGRWHRLMRDRPLYFTEEILLMRGSHSALRHLQILAIASLC